MKINDYFQVTVLAQFFDRENNEEYSKELTLDEAMFLSVKDIIDEALSRFFKVWRIKGVWVNNKPRVSMPLYV